MNSPHKGESHTPHPQNSTGEAIARLIDKALVEENPLYLQGIKEGKRLAYREMEGELLRVRVTYDRAENANKSAFEAWRTMSAGMQHLADHLRTQLDKLTPNHQSE